MSSTKKPLFPQSFSIDFEVLTVEPWGAVDANQLRQSLVSRVAALTDEQLLDACYLEDDEPEDFSGYDRHLLERFHPDVKGAIMNNKKNDLVLTHEQSVEMTDQLTDILITMYGLEGSLETVVDEHGNKSYTKESQERFDSWNAEADQILFALGLTAEIQS